MKQALTEIVNVILTRIEEHPEARASEINLRSWLAGQGYKKRDIDAAIRLVRPRFAKPEPLYGDRKPGTVRTLSDHELRKLLPEARAALIRLDMCELLGPAERELLLDRILQYEGMIGLDDLDYLLSWAVYSVRDVESQQTIFNLLEGQRETLN